MGQPHPLFQTRRAGVLLHPTSLPGGSGIGDIGPAARSFIDWCGDAGFSLWQMLPIGPAGTGNSPYSPRSAFACEPLLISLEDLVEDGLLSKREITPPPELRSGAVRYAAVRRFKMPLLRRAWLRSDAEGGWRRLSAYRRRNEAWLADWAQFAGDNVAGDDVAGEGRFQVFLQATFDRQWKALRAAASRRGVSLVGDLPIFVVEESCDVATRPELFRLDRSGRPTVVTGVPPDCFSPTGQKWDHPHYRWSAHKAEKWKWWTARFARQLELFDALRVDHFVGFHHLYEIPLDAENAVQGRWRRTPGAELLNTVRRRLGPMPLIAEDLGEVTPQVVAMRERHGLPGMVLLQHAFDRDDSPGLPFHHDRMTVVYPGTHDNDTTCGWWRDQSRQVRERLICLAGPDNPAWALIRLAMGSQAATAIVPMQDVLGLGRAARMNRPGTPRGNWNWRLDRPPNGKLAGRLADLIGLTGRGGEKRL